MKVRSWTTRHLEQSRNYIRELPKNIYLLPDRQLVPLMLVCVTRRPSCDQNSCYAYFPGKMLAHYTASKRSLIKGKMLEISAAATLLVLEWASIVLGKQSMAYRVFIATKRPYNNVIILLRQGGRNRATQQVFCLM